MTTLTVKIDNKIKKRAQERAKKEGATMTFLVSRFLDLYVRGDVSFDLSVKDKDSAYFYTKEWQKMEAEADEDIANGRYKTFGNVEDLIKDLNA